MLSALDEPVRIVAYAVGVAGGTWLGMTVDERLSTGASLFRLVIDGDADTVAAALRARGWPAMRVVADGVHGTVGIVTVAVGDHVVRCLAADLDDVAPHAFRTVERLRHVRPTDLPGHMHQPRQRA